jgi:hypothetical protein
VVWIDAQGKSGLFTSDGSVKPYIRTLLDHGTTVYGVDLFLQGEFLNDGRDASQARWLEGEQAFCGWTYCYNLPPFAQRVHDVMSVVALARSQGFRQQNIDLVGLGPAGPWAAAAAVQCQSTIGRAAIDTHGFRFAELANVYDINFLPGAAKYGDIPGLLALAAPTKLWLAGEGNGAPRIVTAAYRAASRLDRFTVSPGANGDLATQAVEWLLTEGKKGHACSSPPQVRTRPLMHCSA